LKHWKIVIIILAVFLMLLAVFSEVAFAENPNLSILVERGFANNPLIRAAHEKVVFAEAELREANADMGPKVGAAAGGIVGGDDFSMQLPVAGSGNAVIPVGFRNTYITAVGFLQTIYSGGSLCSIKQGKTLALDAARAEETRVRQSVANSVQVTYYNRKRAEEKEIVAEEAVSLAKDHLLKAEALFRSGVVARGDVLRSRVAVAQSKLDLIRAQNAAESSLTVLERAVGTVVYPEDLTCNIGDNCRQSPDITEISVDEMVQNAYAGRQEIKMYSLLSRQAEKLAKAAAGQLLPQIMAGGAYFNADDSFLPRGDDNWKVGIVAYWTLFDSGKAKSKTEQSKAKARELLDRLDDMKNIIRTEVTQAGLNLRSAQRRLNVTEHQVAVSEEDYRITKQRYQEHVGTNLDLLDARLALTDSRREFVDALYDIEIAKANLIYAIGSE